MRKNLDARGIGGVAGVWFKACLVIVAATVALIFGGGQGHAQAIVASINGDPITDIDIDQRMKLLRVLRKPATRDAAIESLFTDHLETAKPGNLASSQETRILRSKSSRLRMR